MKRKSAGSDVTTRANNERHLSLAMQQLAEELSRPIIKKIKTRTVYSAFKDNIWGAGLADMQSKSKFNKGFRFLLCAIDIFSKYAWFAPLKDKNMCNYC